MALVPLSAISSSVSFGTLITSLVGAVEQCRSVWQRQSRLFSRSDREKLHGLVSVFSADVVDMFGDARKPADFDWKVRVQALLETTEQVCESLGVHRSSAPVQRTRSFPSREKLTRFFRRRDDKDQQDEVIISSHLDLALVVLRMAGRNHEQSVIVSRLASADYERSRYASPFDPALIPLRDISLQPPADEEYQNAYSFLSDGAYERRHAKIRKERLHNTCEWFRQERSFKEWLNGESQPVFWLQGRAGCGKSVLMSSLVDAFREERSYTYFYMAHSTVQDGNDVIGGIAQQLCKAYSWPLQNTPKEYDELKDLLKAIVTDQKLSVCIFIDGLDEANVHDTDRIRDLFDHFLALRCKVLISSRSPPRHEVLPKARTLCKRFEITPELNAEDMRKLIRTKISNSWLVQHAYQDEISRTKLEQSILKIAEGRYFLCEAHMQELLLQRSRRDFLEVISELHQSRSTEDVLKSILNLTLLPTSNSDATLAQRALIWLSGMENPLSLEGFCQALTVAEMNESPELLHELTADVVLTPEAVIRSCNRLLRFDEDSGTVAIIDYELQLRIAPYSKEHKDVNYEERLAELAVACLGYLLLDEFSKGPCRTSDDLRQRLRRWPFLPYAACNWLHNFLRTPNTRLQPLVAEFLSKPEHVKTAAQIFYLFQGNSTFDDSEVPRSYYQSRECTGLHLVVDHGLSRTDVVSLLDKQLRPRSLPEPAECEKLLRGLLEDCCIPARLTKDDEAHGERTASALIGADTIANLSFADDAIAVECREPILSWAIDRKRASTVATILNYRNRNSEEPWPTTRDLAYAVDRQEPDISIVSMLLENCWPDTRSTITPLQVACKRGHTEIVDRLIRNRIFLGAPENSEYAPPLHIAVEEGHVDIVRMLLRSGADAFTDQRERTALHCAVNTGKENLVRLVLASATNVRSRDRDGKLAWDYRHSDRMDSLLHMYGAVGVH